MPFPIRLQNNIAYFFSPDKYNRVITVNIDQHNNSDYDGVLL